MTPSLHQDRALCAINTWYRDPTAPQVFYLAGYAGTGKTTLASYFLATSSISSLTATYSGKAAHVLRTKGTPAHTIHSLAYEPIPDSHPVEFRLAQDSSPIRDADLLVLDEVSMVSAEMAEHLRTLARRILVLGDPGQLPPIRGQGAFTSTTPDFFLSEIHRQALDSPILRLADRARRGLPITAAHSEPAAQVLPYSSQYVADHTTTPHHQLICGTHRHRWQLTDIARRAAHHDHHRTLADPNAPLPTLPLLGEPVICLRNERAAGLYNGTTGTPTSSPTPAAQRGLFRFTFRPDYATPTTLAQPVISEDRPFREHQARRSLPPDSTTQRRGIQSFDFAYALTCHKAQGSEWPHVTVLDDSSYFREHRHRWLYTAMTRASETLTILRR
jgi:exodeoxyribonuclease V